MIKKHLLSVKDLEISFTNNSITSKVIKGISYNLFPNEILGIVGESGSGKSVSSLAIAGLLPKQNCTIDKGDIFFKNLDLITLRTKSFEALRGNDIAMIFQEPMSSLNPSMTCGKQVLEVLLKHTKQTKTDAKKNVLELFESVKLPDPSIVFNKYPHEISGGQKQRVMIALAIACKPKLLIADEPTTALDVTVQKEIILLLKDLQKQFEMSIIFISHDLSLVSEIANRVLVMYQGAIVEQGTVKDIFKNPQHIYTKALISSKPSLNVRLKQLPTIDDYMNNNILDAVVSSKERVKKHEALYSNPPLLEVKNVSKEYLSKHGFFGKSSVFKAVNNVSFNVYEGETLGLVGESGCGKSSLGNAILQLHSVSSGSIYYKGIDITKLSNKKLRTLRKDIQIIFQDPYASLNPRISIGNAIMEPMKVHGLFNSSKERKEKVLELLERVGLSAEYFDRYPHEFSGGQRQRIGIARTIALQPKLIVCDESVSALDISVQAQVLNLLNELKESYS